MSPTALVPPRVMDPMQAMLQTPHSPTVQPDGPDRRCATPPAQDAAALVGKHIGVFTGVAEMGGSEVVVADVIEAAVRAGARVTCWSPPSGAVRDILWGRGLGGEVRYRDWPPSVPTRVVDGKSGPGAARPGWSLPRVWRACAPVWLLRLAGFFKDSVRFASELRANRPDLIFVHVNASEGVALGCRAVMGLRFIGNYHLSLSQPHPGWLARSADWLKKVLSMWACPTVVHVSQAVRDQWCRHCGYPRSRTRVIYNGVELPPGREPAVDTRRSLGVEADAFVFCVPARLHPAKGHRYLVDALARNPAAYGRVRVLFCGDGPAREELEAQVAAAGLGHVVRFLGWRSDLARILGSADCAVLPSVESENLSLAVLESLMVGIPAIVTRVGGMAEAVHDGANGFVVPPRDAVALDTAMQRLVRDPELTARFGHSARQGTLARFSRTRMRAEYVQLFRHILSSM